MSIYTETEDAYILRAWSADYSTIDVYLDEIFYAMQEGHIEILRAEIDANARLDALVLEMEANTWKKHQEWLREHDHTEWLREELRVRNVPPADIEHNIANRNRVLA